MRLLLCCFFFWVGIAAAPAREYAMLHYTQMEGLPGNTVYDVFQDKAGYLWLATNAGVSRFNGLKFENFTTSEGLPDNECFFFREDPYGRLWIATYSGALVYYKDGVFHTRRNTPMLNLPFKTGSLYNIRIEQDSSVSFLFTNASVFLSFKNKERKIFDLSRIRENNRLSMDFRNNNIRNIRKRQGLLEIVYSKGSLLMDEKLRVLQQKMFHLPALIWCFSTPENEYLLSGNVMYDGDMKAFQTIAPQLLAGSAVYKIRKYPGVTFTATSQGLWIDTTRILENIMISNVFRDRDHNYWISTMGNGVYKLSGDFREMFFFRELCRDPVVFATGNKDALFLGTRNRDMYVLGNAGPVKLSDFKQKTGITSKGMRTGYYADAKYILNCSEANYFLIDRSTPAHLQRKWLLDSPGTAKILFKAPYLYLYSVGAINIVNYKQLLAQQNVKTRLISFPGFARFSPIYDVAQASDSSIWSVVDNRLYRLTDTVPVEQPQLGNLALRAFIFTKHALIGYTYENKLFVIHNYDSQAPAIDSNFKNDVVWNKFYPLNDSVVIVSSNKAYKIITTTSTTHRINTLEHAFLPARAEYIYSDGTLCYFFKDRSVTGISIAGLMTGPRAPSLHFEGIQTPHLDRRIDPVTELAYKESRNVRISFGILSFESASPEFEYSIGTRQDTAALWQQSGEDHINLYNVSPGTYVVKIRAITATGVYSNTLAFTLVIHRPFWLSWWFLSLSLLALLLLLYAGIRFFIQRAERARKQEMKFLKSEFIALNALMNPHFIFNSLNSVQSLVSKNDPEAASKYIGTFSNLVRQNMHNLTTDRITLEKEMQLVANYLELEKLRFKEWLDYTITIDEALETDLILVPPLLVQPLVENAIKHGLWAAKVKQGFIHIRITEAGNIVKIAVTDNGPGLGGMDKQETSHQSVALANIRARLQKLSLIHKQRIVLDITEQKDASGQVTGVCSCLEIYL